MATKKKENKKDSFFFATITLLSILFLFGTTYYYEYWLSLESNFDLEPMNFFIQYLWIPFIYFSVSFITWIFMFINCFIKKENYINIIISIFMVTITLFSYYFKNFS